MTTAGLCCEECGFGLGEVVFTTGGFDEGEGEEEEEGGEDIFFGWSFTDAEGDCRTLVSPTARGSRVRISFSWLECSRLIVYEDFDIVLSPC